MGEKRKPHAPPIEPTRGARCASRLRADRRAVGHVLSAAAATEAARLAEVVKLVRLADEDLPLTLDPVEYRGLEYQTGVSFSVFALKGRQELARGGRYSAGYPEDGVSEPGCGKGRGEGGGRGSWATCLRAETGSVLYYH